MKGLQTAQLGIFLLLLAMGVYLFGVATIFVGFGGLLAGGAEAAWAAKAVHFGAVTFVIGAAVGVIGKVLCVGIPEEQCRTLVIASLVMDGINAFIKYLVSSGKIISMIGGASSAIMLAIGIPLTLFVCFILSYVFFLMFLARLGDTIGQERVAPLVSWLWWGFGAMFLLSLGVFFAPLGSGLATCVVAIITLYAYTKVLWILHRGMPLYVEEVRLGLTDPTESGEARRQAEARAKRDKESNRSGPSQAKPQEEPTGEPPVGHLLYRIPKALPPLHMAVKEGDKFKVETQITMGGNPTEAIKHDLTPLHIAASVGVMEVADTLLKAGADINAVCEQGLSPIFMAVQTANHNMVGFMIQRGANIHHRNFQDYTPLHWACCAPYHGLIGPSRVKMVDILAKGGADFSATTADGKTPKDLALENELNELVGYIDRHLGTAPARPVTYDDSSDIQVTDVQAAPAGGVWGSYLVEYPKDISPLAAAVKEGDPGKVQIQIVAGGDINETFGPGLSLMHISALTGVMGVTDLLLKHGMAVDIEAEGGVTPLYLAIHVDNYAMAGFLMSRGANPNHKDKEGLTPLHWACGALHEKLEGQNRRKLVQMLIAQGADEKAKDNEGRTPLDHAVIGEHEAVIAIMAKAEEDESEKESKPEDEYYK